MIEKNREKIRGGGCRGQSHPETKGKGKKEVRGRRRRRKEEKGGVNEVVDMLLFVELEKGEKLSTAGYCGW